MNTDFSLSLPPGKRILVVTGHYGSGKTEFSVSLAFRLAEDKNRPYPRLALVDLDIVNPYFRSRERMSLLESAGVKVYGGIYKTEITAELPELAADIRAPLEDKGSFVIVDAGGNDSGAKVLNQFRKYLTPEETSVVAVLNFNRFETRDTDSALEHVRAIEAVTGLTVTGIVNNTHLLRETTADTVLRGHRLSAEFCGKTGKALLFDCYPEALVARDALTEIHGHLMPLGLYMRPTWLDK
jgi:cellulose biosynthesis protein BcsQ